MDVHEIRRLMMENPSLRLAVSLHEAAHVHYGTKAGLKVKLYSGPCQTAKGFSAAGVQLDAGEGVNLSLIELARWLCSGSVVKRILSPAHWASDENEEDWETYMKYVGEKATEAKARETWAEAQRDVERDLRSPAFRRQMWALAREVEAKIPWES